MLSTYVSYGHILGMLDFTKIWLSRTNLCQSTHGKFLVSQVKQVTSRDGNRSGFHFFILSQNNLLVNVISTGYHGSRFCIVSEVLS